MRNERDPATPRAVALAATLLTLASVACGGAARKGAEPATAVQDAPPEADPTTVEEAQARIDRARGELSGAPGGGATGTTAPAASPESTDVTPAEPAPSRNAQEPPISACASSCRALASMRRSVDVLCRIAGDADERCTRARGTLTESEARVTAQPCRC